MLMDGPEATPKKVRVRPGVRVRVRPRVRVRVRVGGRDPMPKGSETPTLSRCHPAERPSRRVQCCGGGCAGRPVPTLPPPLPLPLPLPLTPTQGRLLAAARDPSGNYDPNYDQLPAATRARQIAQVRVRVRVRVRFKG